jgi:hypothetical protein
VVQHRAGTSYLVKDLYLLVLDDSSSSESTRRNYLLPKSEPAGGLEHSAGCPEGAARGGRSLLYIVSAMQHTNIQRLCYAAH